MIAISARSSALCDEGQASFPSVSTMVQSGLHGRLPLLGVNLDEELVQ
ncbi:MAG: hypothetical protein KTR18_05035 [Acidiferrobacterales bacterium]|nr:hypothetical protein [Acidiferrobacterales bacterium]